MMVKINNDGCCYFYKVEILPIDSNTIYIKKYVGHIAGYLFLELCISIDVKLVPLIRLAVISCASLFQASQSLISYIWSQFSTRCRLVLVLNSGATMLVYIFISCDQHGHL